LKTDAAPGPGSYHRRERTGPVTARKAHFAS
jgi:hypothetical protein